MYWDDQGLFCVRGGISAKLCAGLGPADFEKKREQLDFSL